MEKAQIHCMLDLMISLRDATTGLAVDERNVSFKVEGENIAATAKGEGCYVFLNIGREDRLMQIEVYGYEPVSLNVKYEELDKVMPMADVFLIPSENSKLGKDCLTLKGKLSGIKEITAIHPGRPVATVRELDVKKRILTLFLPNRRINLTDVGYGVYNAEKNTFEELEVLEELSEKKVRLRKNPDDEFPTNSPIFRIIRGQVNEDGSYLLKVRNDGKKLKFLVKYIVDGEKRYKTIDFLAEKIESLD
ncbi:MAG: hypothetical protein IJ796_03510 [Lachnospiraceae bacterium]|nr:hypothetical protein [Lachnospiraceae bacterium]